MSRWIAYKITNVVNGKAYIGITGKKLRRRWTEHWCDAMRHRTKRRLSAAIRKHGGSSFEIEHIASARTWQDLCEVERILICQEGTYSNGYNSTLGGEGIRGHTVSDSIRAKISKGQKRGLQDNRARLEALKKHARSLAARQKGLPLSPEHVAKLVASHDGKPRTDWQKFGLGKMPKTPEWKANIAAAKRGIPRPPGVIAKLTAANRGRRPSPETRASMAAAQTERWHRLREERGQPSIDELRRLWISGAPFAEMAKAAGQSIEVLRTRISILRAREGNERWPLRQDYKRRSVTDAPTPPLR